MFNTIMVSIDNSDYAEKAIDVAIDLASKYNSKIAAVHVLDENSAFTYDDLDDSGDNLLSQIVEKAKKLDIEVVEHLIMGDALRDMETIIKKTKADLVIMPAWGYHTQLRHIDTKNFIGSVSERALKVSEVPVMIIK